MSYSLGRTVLCGSGVNRRAGFFVKLVTASVLLLHAGAQAQDRNVLTLTHAVTLASEDQPQLTALASQEQAVLEAARAEKELPDPKLAFGVQNLPATDDDAFRFGRDDMTMVTVGVMQDVITRKKREAASARMSAEAARFAAERSLNERTIRRDVALAWLDAFEAQQRATSLRKLVAQLTAEHDVTAGRLASGTGTASAVLGIGTELSAVRDQLIVAQRDEARARAALSRWIGEDALRPLPDALPHDLGANVDLASAAHVLDSHPALESVEHAIDAALRDVDRARAERHPDWGWQLMYGQRRDDRSDMVSFQVTVGLPWNRADRQDRRIAGKLAEANAVRTDMSDRHRMLQAELASTEADLTASAARLREHESGRIPTARARLETAQAAYAGGKGSLLDVWQARRAWIEVELHHDMILADRARALAQLAWLTGSTEILP
jgi:cobalt-zinc-cadmium efflux system outer membrane protein